MRTLPLLALLCLTTTLLSAATAPTTKPAPHPLAGTYHGASQSLQLKNELLHYNGHLNLTQMTIHPDGTLSASTSANFINGTLTHLKNLPLTESEPRLTWKLTQDTITHTAILVPYSPSLACLTIESHENNKKIAASQSFFAIPAK